MTIYNLRYDVPSVQTIGLVIRPISLALGTCWSTKKGYLSRQVAGILYHRNDIYFVRFKCNKNTLGIYGLPHNYYVLPPFVGDHFLEAGQYISECKKT